MLMLKPMRSAQCGAAQMLAGIGAVIFEADSDSDSEADTVDSETDWLVEADCDSEMGTRILMQKLMCSCAG